MDIFAHASIFGRPMLIAYVQGFAVVPDTDDRPMLVAEVTVIGHNGGLLHGVVVPADYVTITTACDICDAIPYGVCDAHAITTH